MGDIKTPHQPVDAMGRLTQVVIGFSGRIKSGKTTISKAVAESLGIEHASFGDFVRYEATRRGVDPESRHNLQAIGESLIEERGWPQFCRDVLQHAGWKHSHPIIVDGIRHVNAVNALLDIVSPLPFFLVHIQLEEQKRIQRLVDQDFDAQRQLDSHSTERDVKNLLPGMADLIVNCNHAIEDIVAAVASTIQ